MNTMAVDEWRSVKLGELGETLIGLTYDPISISRVGTLVLRSSNIQDGRLSLDDKIYVECAVPERIRIRDQDILICVRNGSRRLIGKSVSLDRRVVGQTFGAFMAVFRSDTNAYLRHFFQSNEFKRQIDAHLGATINQITNASLKGFTVLLPHPGEQAAINAHLSDADELIATLERLVAKKQAIKQGMMQQLLTGRTRLPGFDSPWRATRLGDLLKRPPRYGLNAAAVPNSVDAHAYIRITDIDDTGRFAPQPKVSVRHPNAPDYLLRNGELVFARTGASVGKSYLYDTLDGTLVYAGFLINVAPNSQVLNPGFLACFAQTARYWDWVARTSVRSGQPGINGREYAQLEIALPDIREQHVITGTLQETDREIRIIGKRITKAKAIKQGMMQELLTGRTRLPVAESTYE